MSRCQTSYLGNQQVHHFQKIQENLGYQVNQGFHDLLSVLLVLRPLQLPEARGDQRYRGYLDSRGYRYLPSFP